jgi:hypothetical protein
MGSTNLVYPQRDPAYLNFVREQPCLVFRCGQRTEVHHAKRDWQPVSDGGGSKKGSDYCAVSLCRAHHMELHALGQGAWSDRHGVDVERSIVGLLVRYLVRVQSPAQSAISSSLVGVQ